MFRNLKAEMARKALLSKDIATTLNIAEKSITNKMTGKTEFTRKEMLKIRGTFFPWCTMDYLFGDADDDE